MGGKYLVEHLDMLTDVIINGINEVPLCSLMHNRYPFLDDFFIFFQSAIT